MISTTSYIELDELICDSKLLIDDRDAERKMNSSDTMLKL